MKTWILGGLALACGLAACSNNVKITAEATGSTGSSSSGTMNTQGSGGASTTSSSSSSSGTGGSTSSGGASKLVTADTDIGQCASIKLVTLTVDTEQKVIAGPFFVTDVFTGPQTGISLDTVSGGDCSVSWDQHTTVLSVTPQIHGIRLPVLAGQTLCATATAGPGNTYTVLGFRPY